MATCRTTHKQTWSLGHAAADCTSEPGAPPPPLQDVVISFSVGVNLYSFWRGRCQVGRRCVGWGWGGGGLLPNRKNGESVLLSLAGQINPAGRGRRQVFGPH